MDYFETYKRVNDLTDNGRQSHWKPFDKTVGRFLPPNKDAVVIDVGCGAGIMLEWLHKRGYSKAVGIDPDEGQIAFCRELGLPAEQAADSAEWLANKRADMLICKDILEHIPQEQVRAILAAAKKTLGEGGVLYIAVPNAASSFASLWRYLDVTHLRSYGVHSLRLELECAGFQVVAVRDDDTWVVGSVAGLFRLALRTVFRSVRRLQSIAEFGDDGLRMPLGLNLVMVATPVNEKIAGR